MAIGRMFGENKGKFGERRGKVRRMSMGGLDCIGEDVYILELRFRGENEDFRGWL